MDSSYFKKHPVTPVSSKKDVESDDEVEL